jgi:transposase
LRFGCGLQAANARGDGLSIRDLAEETGIPRSTVHRIKRKFARDTSEGPGGTAEDE